MMSAPKAATSSGLETLKHDRATEVGALKAQRRHEHELGAQVLPPSFGVAAELRLLRPRGDEEGDHRQADGDAGCSEDQSLPRLSAGVRRDRPLRGKPDANTRNSTFSAEEYEIWSRV